VDTRVETLNKLRLRAAGPMAIARRFYLLAGVAIVVISAIGFQEFYLRGREFGGTAISPQMLPFVIVHGLALTAWVVLFLAQTALISSRQRKIHMTLGWCAAGLGTLIVISGLLVAVRSVQADPLFIFWGMEYRQFLLVMLTEISCFAVLLTVGLLNRKRPVRHRAMMLLATLSIIAGATLRIPVLFTVFGTVGWEGIFGPVLVLGAVLLAIRSALLRSLDRWLAVGLAAMAVVFFAAAQVATSAWWVHAAHETFGV
jgi:hypothetical protein